MDNKDMNTMMKTVSPTGPGGIMKLKKIIKELLSKEAPAPQPVEPLNIYGDCSNNIFTPDEEDESKRIELMEAAVQAFQEGRPVIFRASGEGPDYGQAVVSCGGYNTLRSIDYTWTEDF